MHKKKFSRRQFIKAIPGSGGIISVIKNRVGCAWCTARDMIEGDDELKKLFQAEGEVALDLAEVGLLDAVKTGDLQAIKFFLMTKGKGRGFTYDLQDDAKKQDCEITIKVEG